MEVLANTENQTAINNVKHISGKYMNVALKKKNAELVMLKIYPTYTLLLHWLVVFILNVIDMNKNEQETKYDLLANEDNCIMNNKILIVIPLASKK